MMTVIGAVRHAKFAGAGIGLSLFLAFGMPVTANAEQYLRFCNDGDAALYLGRISEDNAISIKTRSALFAGWDKISPGSCSRNYYIELRSHY